MSLRCVPTDEEHGRYAALCDDSTYFCFNCGKSADSPDALEHFCFNCAMSFCSTACVGPYCEGPVAYFCDDCVDPS